MVELHNAHIWRYCELHSELLKKPNRFLNSFQFFLQNWLSNTDSKPNALSSSFRE